MALSPYDLSCWWDVKHKHKNNIVGNLMSRLVYNNDIIKYSGMVPYDLKLRHILMNTLAIAMFGYNLHAQEVSRI